MNAKHRDWLPLSTGSFSSPAMQGNDSPSFLSIGMVWEQGTIVDPCSSSRALSWYFLFYYSMSVSR